MTAATAHAIVGLSPVIPVVTLDDPGDAPDLARALLAGGIPIIELTLRTAGALDAVRRIAEEVPEMLIGAGTVLTPGDADAAIEAGARFLVSPGTTPALLAHLRSVPVPALPGVGSVSEAMAAKDAGFEVLKLFPAVPAGGPAFLRAIGGPVPAVTFCPTGGISLADAPDYLALPNVACVGGSWLTPADRVAGRDWDGIARLARATTDALGGGAGGR